MPVIYNLVVAQHLNKRNKWVKYTEVSTVNYEAIKNVLGTYNLIKS